MQMILFTTKKATVIYRLISSFAFLFLSFQSFANEDLASFCFPKVTSLEGARDSLSFLLLPSEKVSLRPADSCIDVLTSTNRINLLEKFLRKRYTLIQDAKDPAVKMMEHCQIDFITKRKKVVENAGVRLGSQNSIGVGSDSVEEISNAKILLGIGKAGTLEMEGRSLFIQCDKGARGDFNLVFSFSEQYRAQVSTEVSVKSGETLQVASVTKDLAEKSKTLGLPESLYKDIQGKENTSYELVVREENR